MKKLLVAALSLLSSFALGQAKRPFTFEDMMKLKRVEEPAVSPDGKWVMFAAVDVNLEQNTKIPHIWIVALTTSTSTNAALAEGPGENAARQLTNDPVGEDRPRFSPDGKQIAFLMAKEGGQQVWLQDFDSATGTLTGMPRKLTDISTEADGEIWAPDGKNIVFVSKVYPDCADDACNRQRDEALKNSKVKAKIFTRLFYRHWSSYTEFKRSHLFAVPVAGGAARDITPGDHDVPPFTLGGQDMYAISPDGQEVAFTSNHDEVEATSTNNDIFVVPISGGEPKKISVSLGSDSTPLYSADGKWIAWRMQKRAGYESDRFRLVIYDRKSGAIQNLTEDFDRWVGTFAWAPDSQWIYFVTEEAGHGPIYAQAVSGGKRFQVVSGTNDDLTVSADGRWLVFTTMSIAAPNEIAKALTFPAATECHPAAGPEFLSGKGQKCEFKVEQPQVLSNLNRALLAEIAMQPLEPFWFAGAGGTKVEGFVVKPPDFDPQKKYPVKFLIHGGPQGAWGDEWSYRWNPELFAASGYVAVMINPRGSTGYGQQFIDEINGDWGGKPYIDLMRGLDYAEQHFAYIDKQRECALGASYGGYMIDWIAGHSTRFKCLVAHDGLSDTESMYGTTEELWFPEWEFKGTPWTNRAMYRRWSPILAAPNFHTPTLIVHGQLDYRLDLSQGLEMFTTLQRLKVPSKMLYFPDEGHWVLKPQNSRLWYKTVNEWVEQWDK